MEENYWRICISSSEWEMHIFEPISLCLFFKTNMLIFITGQSLLLVLVKMNTLTVSLQEIIVLLFYFVLRVGKPLQSTVSFISWKRKRVQNDIDYHLTKIDPIATNILY